MQRNALLSRANLSRPARRINRGPRKLHLEQLEDRLLLANQAVSVVPDGTMTGNAVSANADEVQISDDGRYVLLRSQAGDLVDGVFDANDYSDIYWRDTGTADQPAVTKMVTRSDINLFHPTDPNQQIFGPHSATTGYNAGGGYPGKQGQTSFNNEASMSGDGEYVAFISNASDLLTKPCQDFLFDYDGDGQVTGEDFDSNCYLGTTGGQGSGLYFRDMFAGLNGVTHAVGRIETDPIRIPIFDPITHAQVGEKVFDGRYIVAEGTVPAVSHTALRGVRIAFVSIYDFASADCFPHISADCRWLPTANLFLYDNGAITQITHYFAGYGVDRVVISADGSGIAFSAQPVPGTAAQVFLFRDGQFHPVSVNNDGEFGTYGYDGYSPFSISADGKVVAFDSTSDNLVSDTVTDTNTNTNTGGSDVFVRNFRDPAHPVTTLVSARRDGLATGDFASRFSQINSNLSDPSLDGRFVVFQSRARDLTVGPVSQGGDVFVRDLMTGTTTLVSTRSDEFDGVGGQLSYLNNQSGLGSTRSLISRDGRFVTFASFADSFNCPDEATQVPAIYTTNVFVRDLKNRTTKLANVSTDGYSASNRGGISPVISNDGQFVAYTSESTNLVPDLTDTNFSIDPYGGAHIPGEDVFRNTTAAASSRVLAHTIYPADTLPDAASLAESYAFTD